MSLRQAEAARRTGKANKVHGHNRAGNRKSRTYVSWENMRKRCNNPHWNGYRRYGGRGIKVCPAWDSFVVFLHDMGDRPLGRTLDRVDPDGDYCKENCRWATAYEQRHNRSKGAPK